MDIMNYFQNLLKDLPKELPNNMLVFKIKKQIIRIKKINKKRNSRNSKNNLKKKKI